MAGSQKSSPRWGGREWSSRICRLPSNMARLACGLKAPGADTAFYSSERWVSTFLAFTDLWAS